MKFNLVSITFGSLAALALLAVPFGMTHSAQAEGGRRGHRLEQLNLSDEQSAQIEAIREATRDQKEAILTDEQRATLESSEQRGRRAWRQLDLTDEQRSQLRAIREGSREQMQGVLSEDQRQQMEEMRSERGNRRGARGEGRGNR